MHAPTLLDDFDAGQRSCLCGSQLGCHTGSLLLDIVHAPNTIATGDKGKAAFAGRIPSICLVGAVLLGANDEWQLQHRHMQTEPMAEFPPPLIEAIPTPIATLAA